MADYSQSSVKELREILQRRGVDHADCLEKQDLIKRVEETADKEPKGSGAHPVHVVGQEEFNKWLNTPNVLVCADFTATWCPPCRRIGPVFAELAQTHGDRAVFLHVDVDQNRGKLKEGNDVTGVPTFKFWKNGKFIKQFSGADEDQLRSTIANHL